MRIAVLLMAFPMLGGSLLGCTVNAPTCPSTTVVLDAAVDGLPDVGEYGSSALCAELCGPAGYRCCRVKELVFTCTPSCN